MLFLPCSMRCSFRPMAGSYLETVCSHVRWKGACANLRRQTSSAITGNNNSHDKWYDHKHGTKKKSESLTGIEPVTFRAPVGYSNRLSYEGLVRAKPFARFVWCIGIWPSSPQVHRSSVVRISERWTEGLRFNSSGGLRSFLLSRARDMLITTLVIIFFAKIKINYLSLFTTTIAMPPTLFNSLITCNLEQNWQRVFDGTTSEYGNLWTIPLCGPITWAK